LTPLPQQRQPGPRRRRDEATEQQRDEAKNGDLASLPLVCGRVGLRAVVSLFSWERVGLRAVLLLS
jgi:hypothetical protein